MRLRFGILPALFGLTMMLSTACAPPPPVGEPWIPNQVDIVTSGSTIQVRVVGYLPNPCYSLTTEVTGPLSGLIVVRLSKVDTSSGLLCTQVILPVDRTIPIGPLPTGAYVVRVGTTEYPVTV